MDKRGRSPSGLGVQRRYYGDRWGYGLGVLLAADPPHGIAIQLLVPAFRLRPRADPVQPTVL